jgi:hypothetical protein
MFTLMGKVLDECLTGNCFRIAWKAILEAAADSKNRLILTCLGREIMGTRRFWRCSTLAARTGNASSWRWSD